MNTLPTKPPGPEPIEPAEVKAIPTWRELGERFRDLLKDLGAELGAIWKKEGKDLERDLEGRLLPALRRARGEIEKLIARLEDRAAKKGS